MAAHSVSSSSPSGSIPSSPPPFPTADNTSAKDHSAAASASAPVTSLPTLPPAAAFPSEKHLESEILDRQLSTNNQKNNDMNPGPAQDDLPNFTWRAVAVGLFIGILLCFTNMYFGLQTGWISMMSLQSSLLGYAIFRALKPYLKIPFGPKENIVLQSIAVATGTMPLAAGFVGIIPALGMLTFKDSPSTGPIFLSTGQMLLWCLAIAFFGVFIAVPLRTQVIIKEKLPFPSGTATAQMIGVLHNVPLVHVDNVGQSTSVDREYLESDPAALEASGHLLRRRHGAATDAEDDVESRGALTRNGGAGSDSDDNTVEASRYQSFSNSPVAQSPSNGKFQNQNSSSPTAPQRAALTSSQSFVDTSAVLPGQLHGEGVNEIEIEGEEGGAFKLGQDFLQEKSWKINMTALGVSFTLSGVYTLLNYFFPVVGAIPIFDWLTGNTYRVGGIWQWYFTPSLSYAGQGIIMGFPTTASMLVGAVVGWGILSPICTHLGWVTGPVSSSASGAKGWILWISLGIMIAESVVSLLGVVVLSLVAHYRQQTKIKRQREAIASFGDATPDELLRLQADGSSTDGDSALDDAPIDQLVPLKIWVCGLILSSALCLLLIWVVFADEAMPAYATLLALVLGSLLSILGVRALGSTDLNPVSGIGKVSQFVFAGVVPGNIVANLIAGGIAEAGAQQAGDLMQDLKTGHLMGASPKAQFYGQLIGSVASVFISTGVYQLYSHAYTLPGPEFPVPTAAVWLDLARLVNGHSLPTNVGPFVWGFAALFVGLTLLTVVYSDVAFLSRRDGSGNLRQKPKWLRWIPNGIAVAIGMYNLPNFTLARFVGGVISLWWDWHCRRYPNGKYAKLGRVFLIIIASGFVLGEGTLSIVSLILKTAGVHSLSCVGCYAGMCNCN